jgi:hypothetical protein
VAVQRLIEVSQPVVIGEDGLLPIHNGNETLRDVNAEPVATTHQQKTGFSVLSHSARVVGDLPYSREIGAC